MLLESLALKARNPDGRHILWSRDQQIGRAGVRGKNVVFIGP